VMLSLSVIHNILKDDSAFRTSVSSHPVAQCHIPEDLNPQPYCCENLMSYIVVCGYAFANVLY
jgi:hypothetical protein